MVESQQTDTAVDRWKAISLTYVEYETGDVIGYLLAWFSLLPVFVVVGFITLIFFKRDLHTICYFLGVILNELINLVLKHIIKEPRPVRGHRGVLSEYGMPSNHTQFIWFFTTYLIFFLFIRVHQNIYSLDIIWKYVTSLGAVVTACLVSLSRVYLQYHTVGQVLCGCVVGAVVGLVWFSVVHKVLTPYFPLIVSWPVCEFFMLRDCTLIPNVLWFEYTCHRSEARSRLRKVTCRKTS